MSDLLLKNPPPKDKITFLFELTFQGVGVCFRKGDDKYAISFSHKEREENSIDWEEFKKIIDERFVCQKY